GSSSQRWLAATRVSQSLITCLTCSASTSRNTWLEVAAHGKLLRVPGSTCPSQPAEPPHPLGHSCQRRHPCRFPQDDQCQDQGHRVPHSALVPSILNVLKGSIDGQRIDLL